MADEKREKPCIMAHVRNEMMPGWCEVDDNGNEAVELGRIRTTHANANEKPNLSPWLTYQCGWGGIDIECPQDIASQWQRIKRTF